MSRSTVNYAACWDSATLWLRLTGCPCRGHHQMKRFGFLAWGNRFSDIRVGDGELLRAMQDGIAAVDFSAANGREVEQE